MAPDCPVCYMPCDREIHAATLSVRRWLRHRMRLVIGGIDPLPTLGPSVGVIPTYDPYTNGRGGISLRLDGPATTALLRGEVAEVTTPDYVAAQNVNALRTGGSRYAQAAALFAPNVIQA